MAGLYIHVPFCKSRCIYCGFYSTTSLAQRENYVDALCREMELRPAPEALGGNYPISTLYLGGGTPSLLTREQLLKLFHGIENSYGQHLLHSPHQAMEITMECNPDDVTDEFCETLSMLPINRISMGAQTFDENRLRFLHRRHQASEVAAAVERLRAIGINNISIDLMFGFPQETLPQWQEDLDAAISLGVEHISAYSLMYEEGTPLYKLREKGTIEEINEETSRQMYDSLIQRLTAAGYEHYEISNFAKPGYRSRHNSSYWHEEPYIGIGAAAHSYHRGKEVKRSWNIANLKEYCSKIETEGNATEDYEILDIDTQYNDLIATSLRTSDGIDIEHMRKEFGADRAQTLVQEAAPIIERGLLQLKDGHLSLTREGLYISDDVMSDLVVV